MDRVGKKRKKGMEHKRGTVNAWVGVAGELNSMLNLEFLLDLERTWRGPTLKKKEIIFKLIHGDVRNRNGVVVKQNWR